jgi:hypothetical protein
MCYILPLVIATNALGASWRSLFVQLVPSLDAVVSIADPSKITTAPLCYPQPPISQLSISANVINYHCACLSNALMKVIYGLGLVHRVQG